MIWLVLGVLLWSGAHLLPSLGVATRNAWIERIGEDPYKGVFSLSLVASIALMVVGWRGTAPDFLYSPPSWGSAAALPLMALALLLFVASALPTNIKRILRHPQLTGVATWSVAHLLSNGDSRAVVLFGGLGVWSVVAMFCISRRDGAWQKPEALPLQVELKPVVGAAVALVLIYFAHPYIAGMPIPLP